MRNESEFQILSDLRTWTKRGVSINFCEVLSKSMTLSAFKGILNNVSKEFLISPLVDSGVASVEVVYLVLKGRMNKRDAFRHLIKEAAGSINSSATVLGTLLILRALSYIPTPGRIAILIVAKIAVKKFRNR